MATPTLPPEKLTPEKPRKIAPRDGQVAPRERVRNGLAAAALLAGGIGATAIGLMTVLAEASAAIKTTLTFYTPAGPLSGKTTVGVIIWLVAWAVLGYAWKDKDVDFYRVSWIAFALLGVGLLGTFPPLFELFAGG